MFPYKDFIAFKPEDADTPGYDARDQVGRTDRGKQEQTLESRNKQDPKEACDSPGKDP
jgi:hypothetical protein